MSATQVTAKAIAFLDTLRRQTGLPSTWQVDVPAEGLPASRIAEVSGLPVGQIEGVFHNFSISGLDACIMPGDRVAFVPPGTPASHPAFFGAFVTRR
jgi:hypothetical protein